MLHLQIEKILKNTLESDNQKVLDALFIKSKYIERLMEGFKTKEITLGYKIYDLNYKSYLIENLEW